MTKFLRLFQLTLAISLCLSTLLFVVWSVHWPLVGDASLIHYIAFLIQHGMAPYRDVKEMSMPGTFLTEVAGMHLFGMGALAWRIFDFTLLAIAAGSFAVLTRRAGWFPAVMAGTLFALVHGRDGLAQGGQRDLTMAVLLVAAAAAIAIAVRRRSTVAMSAFGFLSGMALTIKPTAVPLTTVHLLIAVYVLRKRKEPWTKMAIAATVSSLIFPLIAFGFLVREHAIRAFLDNFLGLVPYYASLGHKPLGFLLVHSVSPVMALVAMWFVVLALAPPRVDWERAILLSGAAFGLLSYLIQARGFPYYRYPLLAFLIPVMSLDFTLAARGWGSTNLRRVAAVVALLALAVGGLVLGPQSAVLIHRYRYWEDDFGISLEHNLERLGGQSLSGNVQCIDSISGCVTTLYRMQLLPASGIVMDFPLFGDARRSVVQKARTEFRDKVFQHPPRVIVVTSPLYVDGPGEYRKLALWPELPEFLAHDYNLDTDWDPTRTMRWWSREELGPSYRIYVRRTMLAP